MLHNVMSNGRGTHGLAGLRIDPPAMSGQDEFLGLIAHVYDAAIGAADWSMVFERLSQMLDDAATALHARPGPHQSGWDQQQLQILRRVGRHLGRALLIEQRLAEAAVPGSMVADAERLSPRERACLSGAARGATSRQIAHRLGLSVHTVNTYLASARGKLQAASRCEAVAIALLLGLLDD
jgi:DNA-binding CsgD family transcriptional regulator